MPGTQEDTMRTFQENLTGSKLHQGVAAGVRAGIIAVGVSRVP
jgi:hypothetical protein